MFEHKPLDRRRVETICLLTVSWSKEHFCCAHLVGVFWYSLMFIFLIVDPHLSSKTLQRRKRIIIDR